MTTTALPAPGGITAHGLARSFGAVHAVRDVSLTAPAGSVTASVGPNGSGKTSLLRVLLGAAEPGAGTVTRPEA